MKLLSLLTLSALLSISACSHCKKEKSCCSKGEKMSCDKDKKDCKGDSMKDCQDESCKKKN